MALQRKIAKLFRRRPKWPSILPRVIISLLAKKFANDNVENFGELLDK